MIPHKPTPEEIRLQAEARLHADHKDKGKAAESVAARGTKMPLENDMPVAKNGSGDFYKNTFAQLERDEHPGDVPGIRNDLIDIKGDGKPRIPSADSKEK